LFINSILISSTFAAVYFLIVYIIFVVDITGGGGDDVLFEFDNELAINEVKLSQIAFIRFSKDESPKIQ